MTSTLNVSELVEFATLIADNSTQELSNNIDWLISRFKEKNSLELNFWSTRELRAVKQLQLIQMNQNFKDPLPIFVPSYIHVHQNIQNIQKNVATIINRYQLIQIQHGTERIWHISSLLLWFRFFVDEMDFSVIKCMAESFSFETKKLKWACQWNQLTRTKNLK